MESDSSVSIVQLDKNIAEKLSGPTAFLGFES